MEIDELLRHCSFQFTLKKIRWNTGQHRDSVREQGCLLVIQFSTFHGNSYILQHKRLQWSV